MATLIDAFLVDLPPWGCWVSRAHCLALVLWSIASVSAARAANWSLGMNVSSATVRGGAHSGTSVWLAFPSSALTYQPGMRLGYGNLSRTDEVYLDGGGLIIGEEGSTVSLLV